MKMLIWCSRCPGLHPAPSTHTSHLTPNTPHPTPTLNVVKTRSDSDEHEIYFRQQGLKRLSHPRHLVVGALLQLPRHGYTRRIHHPDGRECLENARHALMALPHTTHHATPNTQHTFSIVIAVVYFLHQATIRGGLGRTDCHVSHHFCARRPLPADHLASAILEQLQGNGRVTPKVSKKTKLEQSKLELNKVTAH